MEGGLRPVVTVFLGERGESNIVSPPKETAYFSAIFPRGWSQGSPDGPRSSRTAGWGSPGREPPFPSPCPGSPGPPLFAFTFPRPRDKISSVSLGLQRADARLFPCHLLVSSGVPAGQEGQCPPARTTSPSPAVFLFGG